MTSSYGPTMIIDRCESSHQLPRVASMGDDSGRSARVDRDDSSNEEEELLLHSSATSRLTSSTTSGSTSSLDSNDSLKMHEHSYGSLRLRANPATSTLPHGCAAQSIRFQVVVWDVGPVDVALGRVPMTFRVTMFWEDEENATDNDEPKEDRPPRTEWTMEGRRKAYERVLCDETIVRSIDVPPISLMNCVTFDIVGQPEVCVLREERQKLAKMYERKRHIKTKRLMRWTCLYKTTLLQRNMRLDAFPHDEHVLSLKLGILVHRRPGSRWDMNQYSLGLATEDDSQHSTRIPHGLIVDHARVPDFQYNMDEGLDFHFVPLTMGQEVHIGVPGKGAVRQDSCLEVRLRVARDSGYYDQNIMPLIVLLNIVAITIPISMDSSLFFQRGLLLLNITFVQIGIRMNVDRHLPSVAYQIKMQRIMNQFFFSLLFLVLESSLVYVLHTHHGWNVNATSRIDDVVSSISLVHILGTSYGYYWDKLQLQKRLLYGPTTAGTSKAKMSKHTRSFVGLPV